MTRITFCGSILVDTVKTISVWPEKGMLAQVTGLRRATGGAVPNTAIDLKTLDPSLAVSAVGFVGADDNGDFAVREMEAHGLDCRGVRKLADVPTTFTDVMTVATTGERTFFNMHGADSRLTPDDIDVGRLDCELFHFGYLLLLDGMDAEDAEYGTKAARLLAKVRAAGIKTSIDIVSDTSERFARVVGSALKYTDYAIINEIEGSRATGVAATDLRGICEKLMALGVREKAVIHCPDCGVALDRDGAFVEVPSLQLPEGYIVGSVGAGDAFCSGMLYAIMKGLPSADGLALASCCAAANLAAIDSTSGAKPLAETLALGQTFPRRIR